MQRKTGIIVFAHGSRQDAGNESLIQFVAKLRNQLGIELIEPAFMEFGQPTIPAAIHKLVKQGCNHIFGYALFFVPGAHLQEDIPAIFAATLKNSPGITWEISPPLLADPLLLEFVADRIKTGK